MKVPFSGYTPRKHMQHDHHEHYSKTCICCQIISPLPACSHAVGIVLDTVPAHIVVFRGGGGFKIQSHQTSVIRVKHLLYRNDADLRPAFQFTAEHTGHTVKASVAAHPQQPLACRNISKGLLEYHH